MMYLCHKICLLKMWGTHVYQLVLPNQVPSGLGWYHHTKKVFPSFILFLLLHVKQNVCLFSPWPFLWRHGEEPIEWYLSINNRSGPKQVFSPSFLTISACQLCIIFTLDWEYTSDKNAKPVPWILSCW